MKKKTKAKLSLENLIEEGKQEQKQAKKDFYLISTRRKKAKDKIEKLMNKIDKDKIFEQEQLSSENEKKLNDLYTKIQNIAKIDDTNEILNYLSFKIMVILKKEISDEIKFYQRMLNSEHQKELIDKYNLFKEILDYKKKIIEFLKYLFTKNINEMIEIINKEKANEDKLYCTKLNFSIENENFYYYIIYRGLLIFLTKKKLLTMKDFIMSNFSYIKVKNSEEFTREEINYILLIINNFNENDNLPNLKSFTFIEEKDEDRIKALNRYLENHDVIKEKKTESNDVELIYDDETLTLDKNKLCFRKLFNDFINNDCLKNEEYKIECQKFKYFIESNLYYKNEDEKKELLDFLETFFSSSIVEEMYYKYRERNNKYKFLFKKDNAVKELFENFFIFPFNSLSGSKGSGFTNKYTLDVFISGYINTSYNFDSDLKFDYYVLFFGNFFIISIHECCGHYLFSYYYYVGPEIKSLLTPKYKINKEDKEDPFNEYLYSINKKNKTFELYDRGDKVEVILFGEKLKKLYFSGALFLLDQIYKNEIKLDDFKQKFNYYNKEDSFYELDENKNKDSFLKKLIKRKNIKIENVNEIERTKNTNITMNRNIIPRNVEYDKIKIDDIEYNYISKSDNYIEFPERVRKDILCEMDSKRISWEDYLK